MDFMELSFGEQIKIILKRKNMTIQNLLDLLDSRFKQVHRACIVNDERVRLYNWNEGYFELDNAEKVYMLSKTFRKEEENEG